VRFSSTLKVVVTVLTLVAMCPAAYTQDQTTDQDAFGLKGWRFDVTPFYLWLPAQEGSVTVRGVEAPIDISLGDTIDLLFDSLKFAFTSRAEARKDRLLLTLDILYMNMEETEQTSNGLGVNLQFEQLFLEFGGGYRLGEWPLGSQGKPSVAFEALAGGRFVHFDIDLDLETLGDTGRVKDWAEPFLGGRIRLKLLDNLGFVVRGDVGGFGIGSDLTWSLSGALHYDVSPRVSLAAGYRVLDIDYESGSGANKVKYDVRMHGPGLGVTIHF
jgi:opacity protein-like surface antigen